MMPDTCYQVEGENCIHAGKQFVISPCPSCSVWMNSPQCQQSILLRDEALKFRGKKVVKKSGKPFKSGEKVVTVKGVIPHPQLEGKWAFTFEDDASYVRTTNCKLAEGGEE